MNEEEAKNVQWKEILEPGMNEEEAKNVQWKEILELQRLECYKSQTHLPKGPARVAWQAALKEAVNAKKKKRAEKAQMRHEKEKEIARRVRAGESRSDVEAELESEESMELDDSASSLEDGDRDVIVTSAVRCEPAATSASGRRDVERYGDVLAPRKRTTSSDTVGEREAKRTRSSRPSEVSMELMAPITL
ncbi:uncharacterized protein [Miscanthus floridulus]|uniref:uncharacterized protein n=1 Tax=Miscanthus floridulus TaxID=154761 RepID=UPI003459CC37